MMPAIPSQLAAHLLVEAGEDLLEALDMALGLLEMGLEGVFEWRRCRGLRELGERLGQLTFRVVGVAQLIDKGVVQGGLGHVLLQESVRL